MLLRELRLLCSTDEVGNMLERERGKSERDDFPECGHTLKEFHIYRLFRWV